MATMDTEEKKLTRKHESYDKFIEKYDESRFSTQLVCLLKKIRLENSIGYKLIV